MHRPRLGPAVLAGPGGTGKTTVAEALTGHAQALGDQVWWISAADPVTLSQGLTAVARQLAEAGRRGDCAWRSGRRGPVLAVLENANPTWLLLFADEADDSRVLARRGFSGRVLVSLRARLR